MTEELRPAGAVELAVVERSGFRESSHVGAAIVLDPDGRALAAHGDVDALVLPRSTMKLMQAVAVLRAGAPLEGVQLVLAAASHPGTPEHVRVVREILQRADAAEDALQCPADWPGDADARRAADGPARITMTCSGKHAAFLLACVRNGWPTADYLSPEHPLQLAIRRAVEDFTDEAIERTGVDGCGAPVHAMTLRGLARGVGRVGRGVDEDAARLAAAIRHDPWALDGPDVATLMRETGLIAKSGAEGLLVAATPDGASVAVKILDGSARATMPVALSLLAGTGILDRDLAERVSAATTQPVLGAGRVVGALSSVV